MTTVQTWQYQGRDDKGKLVKGRMEAPTESAVLQRMRGMGLTPVQVGESAGGKGLQRELTIPGFQSGVPLKAIAVMSRQLATMVGAGLPLLRALSILADQTEHKRLAETLGDVRNKVEQGSALSDALARHPDVFPPIMIHIVRAGETGGFLDQSLQSVAKTFESDVKLRQTVQSAMTYPLVVLGIAVVAVAGMLIFIVPVFKKMFADLGGTLPGPTQFLVVLSENMFWIGPLVVIIVAVTYFWWQRNKREPKVRGVVDPILLKVPVFGMLMKKVAISRFTRNLSTMIGAGVPILRALEIVSETAGNAVIKDAVDDIRENVRQGRPIGEALLRHPVFPPMVTSMVAVGEDAGSLETMLGKVADFYDDEVQSMTEQLTSLIEPIMIVVLGVILGFMIVALYMPMFSIYENIG